MILTNKVHLKTGSSMQIVAEVEEFFINFILPIILLAVSVAIFVLFVSPARKELPELKLQLNTKNEEIKVLQAKVDQLSALQTNKDLVVNDLVKMSWALEERDKVPELSQQVRVMSADSKVKFSSLDYANANKSEASTVVTPSSSLTPDPELYREEKVTVIVEVKDIPSVVEFLKTTENSIRLFKVENLRISTRTDGNSADLIMVSPYLNPAFSAYSETAAPINLTDPAYRQFMNRLDTFKNYAKDIDATLPKI